MRTYWVYILASRRNGTLYVGISNDLERRVGEHRQGVGNAFTRRYGVNRLVWSEGFTNVDDAIAFEKRLKRWRRGWKIDLIERDNPQWRDLMPENPPLSSRTTNGRSRT